MLTVSHRGNRHYRKSHQCKNCLPVALAVRLQNGKIFNKFQIKIKWRQLAVYFNTLCRHNFKLIISIFVDFFTKSVNIAFIKPHSACFRVAAELGQQIRTIRNRLKNIKTFYTSCRASRSAVLINADNNDRLAVFLQHT